MKIIVIGYGRVGTQFVKKVDRQAHEVVVIDKDRSALEGAAPPEGVRFVYGNAIDEDLLRDAGAESADVLMALTRDENTNLMLAQMGRVIFNVSRVIATVYDLDRESFFHEAGIETLAITAAGADLLTAGLTGAAVKSIVPSGALKPVPTTRARVAPRKLEAHDGSFYVLVVGGGLVGYYLARSLLKSGHEVTIIERNPATYNLISQQIDCPVVLGEGSSGAVLERSGAARADILCSVTNHDDDNLITCQMAKYRFGVPRTVARAKNPKNEAIMRRLGVDITVSATASMFSVVRNLVPQSAVFNVANLASCPGGIIEFRLTELSGLAGKVVKSIKLPAGCRIIAIVRAGEAVASVETAKLAAGDTLVAFVPQTQEEGVRKILLKS